LRSRFYCFGEIKSITIKLSQGCAFIEFTSRDAAEAAAESLHNNLDVNGISLKLSWAKPQRENDYTPPPPGSYDYGEMVYPSMDPQRLGSAPIGPMKPPSQQGPMKPPSFQKENEDKSETSKPTTSSMYSTMMINTAPMVNTAPEVEEDEDEE